MNLALRFPPKNPLSDASLLALRRNQGIWLVAAAFVTLIAHFSTLPWWVMAFCTALLIWRGERMWRGKTAPPRWVLPPLALLGAIGVQLDVGQLVGKTPGVILLAMLLCFKLLETRNMRDIIVATFLCFFLQFSLFFSNQSLPSALLSIIALLVTLGAIIALSDPASSTRERWRVSATLIVQGIPFMLVLFVLFPRAIAPLWGVPSDAQAKTGLSDSMSPGTISNMILSDELAFTVEFDGLPPLPADRYWRGPVMSYFDGQTWHMVTRPQSSLPAYTPSGRRFSYRILLEPSQQHWLPALDFPAGPIEGAHFTYDYQALSQTPVNSRRQFRLTSFPQTAVGQKEQPWVIEMSRRLPAQGNPRTRELAARLKADSPRQTIKQIIDWLIQARFTYTLQPPLSENDSVDFFLFESRMGFCEHFASSFVFLARAAGIPARVVTGYQGGRINPISHIFTVRQSDAHAWAEIWISEQGWVRIDPTALAAPQRIDQGLEGSVESGLPFMLRPQFAWLRQMRDQWESLAVQWNRWVVSFDGKRQRSLLESMGLESFSAQKAFGIAALAIVLLVAAFYAWIQLKRHNTGRDALDRAWARFSSRLAAFGLARAPAEGPLDYAKRISSARPEDADVLNLICTRYACLRYRLPPSRAEIDELAQTIQSLQFKT